VVLFRIAAERWIGTRSVQYISSKIKREDVDVRVGRRHLDDLKRTLTLTLRFNSMLAAELANN